MFSKEYLTKFNLADLNIKECQSEINYWKRNIFRYSKFIDEKNESKLNDRITTLETKLADLEAFKTKATSQIEALDDSKMKDVLVKRYIEKKKWQDIAEDLFHDVTYIYRLHKKALKEFQKHTERSV